MKQRVSLWHVSERQRSVEAFGSEALTGRRREGALTAECDAKRPLVQPVLVAAALFSIVATFGPGACR
jgi:hypothetical protein